MSHCLIKATARTPFWIFFGQTDTHMPLLKYMIPSINHKIPEFLLQYFNQE